MLPTNASESKVPALLNFGVTVPETMPAAVSAAVPAKSEILSSWPVIRLVLTEAQSPLAGQLTLEASFLAKAFQVKLPSGLGVSTYEWRKNDRVYGVLGPGLTTVWLTK